MALRRRSVRFFFSLSSSRSLCSAWWILRGETAEDRRFTLDGVPVRADMMMILCNGNARNSGVLTKSSRLYLFDVESVGIELYMLADVHTTCILNAYAIALPHLMLHEEMSGNSEKNRRTPIENPILNCGYRNMNAGSKAEKNYDNDEHWQQANNHVMCIIHWYQISESTNTPLPISSSRLKPTNPNHYHQTIKNTTTDMHLTKTEQLNKYTWIIHFTTKPQVLTIIWTTLAPNHKYSNCWTSLKTDLALLFENSDCFHNETSRIVFCKARIGSLENSDWSRIGSPVGSKTRSRILQPSSVPRHHHVNKSKYV